jgi:hypothetical protein
MATDRIKLSNVRKQAAISAKDIRGLSVCFE